MKSPNLRHGQAHSQNKGLSEYQRRASRLQTGPSPAGDRDSGRATQSLKGAISAPEKASSTKLRSGSQLLSKSSWDPGRLTSTRRAARDQLPRGDTAHLRWCSHCAHRKPTGWDQGGDKTHRPPGTVCSPSTWSPELLRPGKGTNRMRSRICVFVEYLRT